MKEKIITIFAIFIILISVISNVVLAEENNITYEIPKAGLTMQLPNKYYDIIQGLKNYDEKVDKYQGVRQNFEKMGIVIDAVDSLDENATREIVVAITKNNTNTNFKDVPENEIEQFMKSFFETIKKQSPEVEFIENNVITTNSENKFMTATTKSKVNEQEINAITYYTIANQQLIGITMRYLGQEIDKEECQNIIESINIVPVEIKKIQFEAVLIVEIVLSLVILAICTFKLVKNKDEKIELTTKQKQKFPKLSGFLMLYFLITIYNIVVRAVIISTAPQISDIWSRRIAVIQGLISLAIFVWIEILIFKKKKESNNQIVKLIFISGLVNIISTLIQTIYVILSTTLQDENTYYIQASSNVFSTIIYTIIWITYFKISKRVKVYFK